MKTVMKKGFTWATAAFITSGCNYTVDKMGRGPEAAPANSGTAQPDAPSPMSFAVVMERAISKACFNCHKSPGNAMGINLETYENVFKFREQIADAVLNRRMPDSKGRTMREEDRQLLLDWIAAGAPFDTPPTTTSQEELR